MSPNQMLKQESKGQLRGHWPQALAVTAVCLAVEAAFMILWEVLSYSIKIPEPPTLFINWRTDWGAFVVGSLIYGIDTIARGFKLLLATPLFLGALKWFYRRAKGEEISVAVMFEYYSSWSQIRRTLTFLFHFVMRIFGWFFLSFLPGTICLLISLGQLLLSPTFHFFRSLGFFLLLLGVPLFIFGVLRLFLAPFLFVDDDTLTIEECFQFSAEKMRCFRGKVISLFCSFLGWLALCVFSFPLLFVLPYFVAALSNSAKWILYENDQALLSDSHYQAIINRVLGPPDPEDDLDL